MFIVKRNFAYCDSSQNIESMVMLLFITHFIVLM